jgi:hypothetical protein
MLVLLMRLSVLAGRIIALTGRDGMAKGDSGRELAIALSVRLMRQNAARVNVMWSRRKQNY